MYRNALVFSVLLSACVGEPPLPSNPELASVYQAYSQELGRPFKVPVIKYTDAECVTVGDVCYHGYYFAKANVIELTTDVLLCHELAHAAQGQANPNTEYAHNEVHEYFTDLCKENQ